jgi:cytochrome c
MRKQRNFKNLRLCAAGSLVVFFLFCCTSDRQPKRVVGQNSADSLLYPDQDPSPQPDHFGFGREASEKEISKLGNAIMPDGRGLPPGSGTVPEGKKIYAVKCAACHGATGVEGPFPHLVSADTSKAKTIGNYWPYATTVFDYIRRAMPYNAPGSLTDGEVYSLTAFLLSANHLVDSGVVLNATTLPKVQMPARSLFIHDDRKGGREVR